jgi:hypothetical protein
MYLVLAIFALAIVYRSSNGVPSVHAQGQWGESLVGTWVITATGNPPAPGAPPVVFTELMKFDRGSGLTETNTIFNANSASNPFLPPTVQLSASDGYGSWLPTNHGNEFATTFQKLMFAGPNTPGSLFPGAQVGVSTISETLTVSEKNGVESLSGPFQIAVTDLSGNVLFQSGGTVQGHRLTVQPLSN